MPATATLSKARVSHALTYALKFFFYVCTSYEYLNDFMDSMEVKQVKKKTDLLMPVQRLATNLACKETY